MSAMVRDFEIRTLRSSRSRLAISFGWGAMLTIWRRRGFVKDGCREKEIDSEMLRDRIKDTRPSDTASVKRVMIIA